MSYSHNHLQPEIFMRPNHRINDGDWSTLIVYGNRASGRTTAGLEWVHRKALENPGSRIAIAGTKTFYDKLGHMLTGIASTESKPDYRSHTKSLHWSNGSSALILTDTNPQQARGPMFHYTFADNVDLWSDTKDSSGLTLLDNLLRATGIVPNHQMVFTHEYAVEESGVISSPVLGKDIRIELWDKIDNYFPEMR